MLSISVDSMNFIGQFQSLESLLGVVRLHKLNTIFVGEFGQIAEDAYKTGHNFYTHMEMNHKVRTILRNCVWNKIPGCPMTFQEDLVKEFDKLAHKWLMTYGYVGHKTQALSIKKYIFQEGSEFQGGRFEEEVKK